jgi:hypothetical protein
MAYRAAQYQSIPDVCSASRNVSMRQRQAGGQSRPQLGGAFRKIAVGLEAPGEYRRHLPTRYIEATREVVCGIDLDPARHEARRSVGAPDCQR